ncbi:helix-hairpin-helix domain-containing protein [Alkalihalobacillus oceani]|uniref:helix-hairpin-helix domain-containing protein n=1 Tax=Halalkalibacter oceani TaxID=1653776 RepID=UPI0020419EDC|nr:helix-hairpin-helix domain-containing protein [Halalkalibacter oceani]MCM3761540.1 helix-hairpin-helix domain-containing protein [Halalkalibacter oceani]
MLKLNRLQLALVGLVALLVSVVLFQHFRNAEIEEAAQPENGFLFEVELEETEEEEPPAVRTIIVDVKGAVHAPGIYQLDEESRVYDVIERAGGFREEAAEQQLNLAERVYDEMMIYVPAEGETEELPGRHGAADAGKIAINQADARELEQLPGIGPAKAEAIITYREEQGRFSDVEQLLDVPGIGVKTLEQLREHISVK